PARSSTLRRKPPAADPAARSSQNSDGFSKGMRRRKSDAAQARRIKGDRRLHMDPPAFAEIKNSGRGKRSPTRLFAGFDRLLRLTARDPLHVVEQIVERLVGLIRHLRKRAQKAVGPRELEQRLLAILWRRRGYQHDIV